MSLGIFIDPSIDDIVRKYVNDIAHHMDCLLQEGFEKCGYNIQWVKEHPDKICIIGGYEKDTYAFVGNELIFKINANYQMEIDSKNNSFRQVYNPKLEIIKTIEKKDKWK